ncbi:MAG: hypothetical protein H0W08_24335 [Acidobacteria bacterium]|nr:hypothetical protein [Acidobacteriota bacterium]
MTGAESIDWGAYEQPVPLAHQPLLPVPVRRPRRKRYRFIIDLDVNPDKVRDGRNPRAWPAAIIRAYLRVALSAMHGHVQTRVVWVSGFRREVSDAD